MNVISTLVSRALAAALLMVAGPTLAESDNTAFSIYLGKTSGAAPLAEPARIDFTEALRASLASEAAGLETELSLPQGTLERIYAAADHSLLWHQGDALSPDAAALLAVIDSATLHGLTPQDYRLDALSDYQDQSVPLYDLALTAMLARYAHVLDQGAYPRRNRISPARLVIEQGGLEAEDPATWLQSRAPNTLAYSRLQDALLEARAAQAEAEVEYPPEMPDGALLRPGSQDPQVTILREILEHYGYLSPPEAVEGSAELTADDPAAITPEPADRLAEPNIEPTAEPASEAALPLDLFDETLAAALREFQRDKGLSVDAVVGRQTRRALNARAADLIPLIQVNLERLRWEAPIDGDRWVRVNIPAYQLTAYENGEAMVEMAVVVGRPSRPTPLMSDYIIDLKFAPDWTMPSSIAVADYAPILNRDPGYAARSGIQVTYNGQNVAPHSVDWSNAALVQQLTLRKPSSGSGPLGGVRFSMGNSLAIYLHDTNRRGLFNEVSRAFSSGCVRVSDAEGLAAFIAGDAMSEDEIGRRMNSSRTSWHQIPEPIRVYLSYMTVWVDEAGELQVTASDPYGLDASLLEHFSQDEA